MVVSMSLTLFYCFLDSIYEKLYDICLSVSDFTYILLEDYSCGAHDRHSFHMRPCQESSSDTLILLLIPLISSFLGVIMDLSYYCQA